MSPSSPVYRPWVPGSAALAPVALIGGWSLAQSLQPASFDPTHDTISALAQQGAPHRWVMTLALVVLGCCHLATAAGLSSARPPGRLLLGLGGVAVLLVAVFALPSSHHAAAANTSFLLLAVWPLVAAFPSRAWGMGVGAVLLVGVVWLALTGPARFGLVERIVAGAQALGPAALVVAARVAKPTSSGHAPRRRGPGT